MVSMIPNRKSSKLVKIENKLSALQGQTGAKALILSKKQESGKSFFCKGKILDKERFLW